MAQMPSQWREPITLKISDNTRPADRYVGQCNWFGRMWLHDPSTGGNYYVVYAVGQFSIVSGLELNSVLRIARTFRSAGR